MDTTPPPTALTPLRPDPAAPAGGRALSQGLASDPAIATRGLTKTFGIADNNAAKGDHADHAGRGKKDYIERFIPYFCCNKHNLY